MGGWRVGGVEGGRMEGGNRLAGVGMATGWVGAGDERSSGGMGVRSRGWEYGGGM